MNLRFRLLLFALIFSSVAFAGRLNAQANFPSLEKLSTERLLDCFADSSICGAGHWDIADTLDKRDVLGSLMARYWGEPKVQIRSGIEKVAYRHDSVLIEHFMRKVRAYQMDDGEGLYYPINYLGKKCDSAALKEIATGRFRSQGSLQYETSVELFGKCGYKPAIPYLVGTAMHDMSLNIVDAAEHSLRKLFPGSPEGFASLEAMQKYYCIRAMKEGFKVTCNARPAQGPD
jgi:hypothetical protein